MSLSGVCLGAVSAAGRLHNATAAEVARGHDHLLLSIAANVAQTLILVGVFYLFSILTGFGTAMVRGDLLIYLITGVCMFNLHIRAMGAVLSGGRIGAQNDAAHPGLAASALACLYVQAYSIAIVAGAYHVFIKSFSIDDAAGLAIAFILCWLSGVGAGLIFLSAKGVFPRLSALAAQAYSRFNMIGSGQMFVANMLPAHVLVYFKWNPLFHLIDQARGFAFLNYSPWFSNMWYPAAATGVLLVVGLLARNSSAGQGAASAGPGKP
ncbi:ABC transporter permease [Leisingera sp. XS_AS12]|uniref:ABC transporter permease n=1 Tax=Leisingera sp. XS_AS12 TaxID=3241294 RepID=UPI00351971A8